jgi:hypothetical protein
MRIGDIEFVINRNELEYRSPPRQYSHSAIAGLITYSMIKHSRQQAYAQAAQAGLLVKNDTFKQWAARMYGRR